MAWCTLAKMLFAGALLISLIPRSLGGKRKPNADVAGIRDCMVHLACECGGDAEVRVFSDCYNEIGNKSRKLAVNWFNGEDKCPDTEGTFEDDPKQMLELMCSQDPDVRDTCLNNVNAALKEYHPKLLLSLDPEDQKEAQTLQNTYDCLTPLYIRCNQYPDSCMD